MLSNTLKESSFLALLLLCSVALGVLALNFASGEQGVGPAAFPLLLCSVLILSLSCLLARSSTRSAIPNQSNYHRPTLLALTLVVYLALIQCCGYAWPTALFLIGVSIWLGFKGRLSLLVVTAAWLVVVNTIFIRILHIPLDW